MEGWKETAEDVAAAVMVVVVVFVVSDSCTTD